MRISLVFLALLTSGLPSFGQQSGLLLGLRVPRCSESDPHCKEGLQTLWIAPQDGSIKMVVELPDLIVPRTDGFWRVGVRNYCQPPDYWSLESEDVFFAVPVSQHPTIKEGLIPCVQAKKMAEERYKELLSKPNKTKRDEDILVELEQNGPVSECSSFSISVEFVNPLYISTSGSYEVACGVHPDGTLSYGVSHFGSLGQPPVSLSSLFGEKATDTYMDLAKQALVDNANDQFKLGNGPPQQAGEYGTDLSLEELSKKDPACFPENVNDQEWYITRQEGRWLEQGGINTHRLCGVMVEFSLPTDKFTWSVIDKSVPLDMKWLRSLLPDARDAFWSPRKDLLVVLTNHGSLSVFKPVGERIGTPLLTLALTGQGQPVMAEWALGAGVERWTRELTTLQHRGFPEPQLQQKIGK